MAEDNVIEFSIKAKNESEKELSSFKNSLLSINSIAVGLAAGSLANLISKSLDFASAIKDTAQRLGFGTTALQQWRFVAQQSGGSVGSLDNALSIFSRSLGAVSAGNKEAKEAFSKLGISISEIQNQSPEKVFERTRDAISNLESASDRSQITFKIFGRQSKDLAGVFSQTTDEAAKLKDEAIRIGAVLKESTVKDAEETGDKFSALSNVMKVQMTEAIVQAAPLLNSVAELLTNIGTFAKYAAFFISGLSQGFQELGTSLGGYAAAAAAAAHLDFKGAREILKVMDADIADIQKRGEAARDAIFQDTPSAGKSTTATSSGSALGGGDASINVAREAQLEWLKELDELRQQELAGLAEELMEEEALRTEYSNRLRDNTGQAHLVRQEELNLEVEQMAEMLGASEELQRYHAEQLVLIEVDRLNEIDALETQSVENRIRLSQNYNDRQAAIIRAALKFRQSSEAQQRQIVADALQQTLADLGTFNKSAFEAWQAYSIAKAIVNTYLGVSAALGAYSPPISFIMAALQLAAGLASVSKIRSQSYSGQAHAGLENVPSEGTFLLNKGERVLAPDQNKDLTNFLSTDSGNKSGSVNVEQLIINIDVPDSHALLNMDRNDWRDIVAKNIIPALDSLDRMGIRQVAVERRQGS